MRVFILLLTLFLTQSMVGQIIIGEQLTINKIIGIDLEDCSEYILNIVEPNEQRKYIYGNVIIFNEDNTFNCNYYASCGNDCFPSSIGTFELIDENRIKLLIKEFNQAGDCENKNILLNVDLGIYAISKTSEGIIKLSLAN